MWLVVFGLGLAGIYSAIGLQATAIVVGIPFAAASFWYAVLRPAAMLCVMIVIEVSNVAEVAGGPAAVLVRVSICMGVLTVILALRDPMMRDRLNRRITWFVGLFACYLTTQFLAVVGSQHIEASVTNFRSTVLDCAYFFVVLLLVLMSERPWLAAGTMVATLAALSLLCLINQVFFGGAMPFGGFAAVAQGAGEFVETPRYGGPTGDANFWGRNLVLGLPLAGALTVRSIGVSRRGLALIWVTSSVLLLSAVYLTQSRGTMIAAVAAVVTWIVGSGRTAQRRGLVALPLVSLLLLVPGVGNRLVSLVADLATSSSVRVLDPSVVGRVAAQQISWAMFRDRPFFGYGPKSFSYEIQNYAGRVPTAVLDFVHGPDAPHNLYAQFAGESGIVGLLGWAVFIGGFVWLIAVVTTRIPHKFADRSLAAAALAAVIGWSIASVFLHMALFRTLSIVLAIGAAYVIAARSYSDQPHTTGTRISPKAVVACGVSLLVGCTIAGGVLLATGLPSYTASQRVIFLPTPAMEDNNAYALSVRDRKSFLPTFATMMSSGAPANVEYSSDSVRGVITISTADVDEDAVRLELSDAIVNARLQLQKFGVDSSYQFAQIGDRVVARKVRWSVWDAAGATVLGLTSALVIAVPLRRWAVRASEKTPRPRHRRRRGNPSGLEYAR